jgi:GNAT superfamily N-acetyltransferase
MSYSLLKSEYTNLILNLSLEMPRDRDYRLRIEQGIGEAMDIEKVLHDYDRFERRGAFIPGYRREETPRLVRMIDPGGQYSYISFSSLSSGDADVTIADEIEYFEGLGQAFEWKLYSHDRPGDLKERLAARGFSIGKDESVMVQELARLQEGPRRGTEHDIRRINDPSLISDVIEVHAKVWDDDPKSYLPRIGSLVRDSPDYISLYVAYMGDMPVCAGWIYFPPDSPFASLWGGSTLSEYRGRGIYSDMLAIRAHEARRRGYSYLTIDASPMSRPIAERRGFCLLSTSNPCERDR